MEPHGGHDSMTPPSDPEVGLGRERITFVPHPRTLTAAGDLEYFTSQRGKQTVSYALAELVDNALSATAGQGEEGGGDGGEGQGAVGSGGSGGGRKVRICFCVNGSGTAASLFVEDNGVGMDRRGVNDWAVMNLSKSERERRESESGPGSLCGTSDAGGGSDPFALTQQHTQRQTQAGRGTQDRFLCSSLSFFGVGSKNAAFFLGDSVHVATRPRGGEGQVLDLSLSARELEERYRRKENAYEAFLHSREPKDTSTLTKEERRFGPVVQAVMSEKCGAGGFTRLTVTNLKREVIGQIKDRQSCEQVCRELAHIYHFYVHGAAGSRGGGSVGAEGGDPVNAMATCLPDGSALPDVDVEFHCDGRLLLRRTLGDVEDDPLSLHLKSQRSEFAFSLEVPGRGRVDGALYYFPFDAEGETMPSSASSASWPYDKDSTHHSELTQANTQQLPNDFLQTQASRGTQRQTQRAARLSQVSLAPDPAALVAVQQRRPLFETFWQGRLIPESRVSSLPFVDATFHSKHLRDKIPPECHGRLWGLLFFGHQFRVTRNKLSFRDNLEDLLMESFSSDRYTEKKFKEWVARCHRELDRTLKFEGINGAEAQAAARRDHGEMCTRFDRVVAGDEAIAAGDVVQLKTTPKVVGRVEGVLAGKVMRSDGRHSAGFLLVAQIPSEVFGRRVQAFPVRRFKAKLSTAEAEAHCKKVWGKAPCHVAVEPLHLATGKVASFGAGDNFPPTYVAVTNAAGQRCTKCVTEGKKQNLSVVQRMYFLGDDGAGEPQDNRAAAAEGEELLCVTNCTPKHEVFGFEKVKGGLKRSGRYLMRFTVEPAAGGRKPLSLEVNISVSAGPCSRMELEWAGGQDLASSHDGCALGEPMPDLSLRLFDDNDNPAPSAAAAVADGGGVEVEVSGAGEAGELVARWVACERHGGGATLSGLTLEPRGGGPLQCFVPRGRAKKQFRPGCIKCKLTVRCGGGDGEGAWAVECSAKISVRPGPPASFDVVDGADLSSNEESNPLQLVQNEPVPSMTLSLRDAYDNATAAPRGSAQWCARVSCEALSPDHREFVFCEDKGTCVVEGLVCEEATFAKCHLRLRREQPPGETVVAETLTCGGGGEGFERVAWLQIEPSSAPSALAILRDGVEFAADPNGSDDLVVEGVGAGAVVEGLEAGVRDATGRQAPCGRVAKITCSWVQGTRQASAGASGCFPLPPLQAPTNCAEVVSFWVRLVVDGIVLESSLMVRPVPGPPRSWAVSSESAKVYCGEPFVVHVEAVDEHQNRCDLADLAAPDLPVPKVEPVSERELEVENGGWEGAWERDEDDARTFVARLALRGEQGPIALRIYSDEGVGMAEDLWQVTLAPGPPSRLTLNLPADAPPEFYTTCHVASVVCHVRDVWGNPIPSCKEFEVVLQPSARSLADEGVFAQVSCKGGNRHKVSGGTCSFEDVSIKCPKPGRYALVCVSKSRKLSVEEATLEIDAKCSNRVVSLEVVEMQEAECQAGGGIDLEVALSTEDGVAPPREAVEDALRIIVAGEEAAREEPLGARLVDYCAEKGRATFATDKVTRAGSYGVTACFQESRAVLGSYTVRSLSCQFSVVPFEPKALSLVPRDAEAALSMIRASDETLGRRPLISGCSFQLQDIYGNATTAEGASISFHLYEDEQHQNEVKGALSCTGSLEIDAEGLFRVGDVGTTEAGADFLRRGDSAAALDCHVAVRCRLGRRQKPFVAWARPLCCSNDEAQAQRRQELASRKASLEGRLQEKRDKLRALEDATVSAKEDLGLGTRSLRNLDAALGEQRAKVAEAEGRGSRPAIARALSKFKTASQVCERVAGADYVGWMVAQATCEHENLARVLSWYRRNKLQVMVFGTGEAMRKARHELKEKRQEIPDMISAEVMRRHDSRRRQTARACKVTSAEAALLGQMGCLSKRLHEDALNGSDDPLPCYLPHHHVDRQHWPEGLEAWPKGFLGHTYNLVRPRRKNTRSTVVYTMTGTTLVFDEWTNAYAYFKCCRRDLKCDVPTCFNLDGTMVDADGVLVGTRAKCPDKITQLKVALGGSDEAVQGERRKLKRIEQLAVMVAEMDKCKGDVTATKRKVQECRQELDRLSAGGRVGRPQSQAAAAALMELDANQAAGPAEEEEVPSSQKRPSPEPQQSRARPSRRRRMIVEMEE